MPFCPHRGGGRVSKQSCNYQQQSWIAAALLPAESPGRAVHLHPKIHLVTQVHGDRKTGGHKWGNIGIYSSNPLNTGEGNSNSWVNLREGSVTFSESPKEIFGLFYERDRKIIKCTFFVWKRTFLNILAPFYR